MNGDEHYGDRRSVYINREYLVFSFANSLNNLSKKDLLKNIKVHYDGEIGSDAGGLRKELFTLTTKYIFDPSYGLFRHTANKTTLEISPFSSIIPNYLKLFEFAGIVLGKVRIPMS